jgi:hypothetical protein
LCPLDVIGEFVFGFITGFFNKVPSFTHFSLLKLPKTYRAGISMRTLFSKNNSQKFSIAPIELSF